MNDIYENCSILKIENLYIVIEKAPSGNAHDPSGCISVLSNHFNSICRLFLLNQPKPKWFQIKIQMRIVISIATSIPMIMRILLVQ